MSGGVSGIEALLRSCDAALTSAEDGGVVRYRMAVKNLFIDILRNTPQWTGKAVANWRIGVNAPDLNYETDVGDHDEVMLARFRRRRGNSEGTVISKGTRKRGDTYWIDYAIELNKTVWQPADRSGPKTNPKKIYSLKDKVFITNRVVGDTDYGRSSENYLDSLQNPSYWKYKLREVNKPYEVVAQTLAKSQLNLFSAL